MDGFALLHQIGQAWDALSPIVGVALALLSVSLIALLGEVVTDPVTLEKGLKTTFFQAYDAATPLYTLLATEEPSNSDREKYGWLGSAPTMREWVDERIPKGLLDHDYTIINNHYEATLGIDKDDLEDDKLGQVRRRVQDMGNRTKRHPDSLLATLLTSGETDLCYDGQAFFDTDHSEGSSGDQDNDLTADATSHTAVTQAEFVASYADAIEHMLGYVDDRGEPYLEEWDLNANNLLAVVPPELRNVALQTANAAIISNTSNVYVNNFRVVTNSRLTNAAKWYLFYTGAPVKPFIFQQRGFNDGQNLHVGLLGDESDTGFMRKTWMFGVDGRYNMGYGLWQYGVLYTFT